MDFITGVGLGNAAIAATAAIGAKDKTFEEKFNERIRVYEDEKKSLEKMIDILKKEKAACESNTAKESGPAEPVPVTATPIPEPVPVTETAAPITDSLPPVVPEIPAPEPLPQPSVEPVPEPLIPEVPLEPEPPLFPENALPPGPPAAAPESAPMPPPAVSAAATRRGLYQQRLQEAKQLAQEDVRTFNPNLSTLTASVTRPLSELPTSSLPSLGAISAARGSQPSFNRLDFPAQTANVPAPVSVSPPAPRGGTRKKKLRTRRATKQKNVGRTRGR